MPGVTDEDAQTLPEGWIAKTGVIDSPGIFLGTPRWYMTVQIIDTNGRCREEASTKFTYNIAKMKKEEVQRIYSNLTRKLVRKIGQADAVTAVVNQTDTFVNLRFRRPRTKDGS